MGGVGARQRIGRLAPVSFRLSDLAHELLALGFDQDGDLGELGHLGPGAANALPQRGDLLLGTGSARAPALLLQADCRLPFRARPTLAPERAELRAAFAARQAEGGGLLL